jgi:restriction system protein
MPAANSKIAGTLPSQAAFFFAILSHLSGRPEGDRRAEIHEAMPDLLHMTEAQRSERLANLPHLRYRHRSGWGLSMLKAAGYVDSPVRGIWRITEQGKDLLAQHRNGFDNQVSRQIIRESKVFQHQPSVVSEEIAADSIELSPDERIDSVSQSLRALEPRETGLRGRDSRSLPPGRRLKSSQSSCSPPFTA